MISSDSDSYGSDGNLKEKEVMVAKRGGKKRNKNKGWDAEHTDDSDVTIQT